jgi:NADPH:quinone reductase-like Zn-dependent oxidoreductase
MRAILHRRYGSAREVLELVDDQPAPVPGDEDLLVRVRATSVNPIDCAVRSGYGAAYFEEIGLVRQPHIPGRDIAGEVVAVGRDVRGFQPGDKIWAGVFSGASAELAIVPENWAAPMPAGICWDEAAAFPFAGLTAWTALVTHARLDPNNARGKRVIVPRGAGGVGGYAIQMLKAWGAHVATIVSTRNVALVEELGADVIIDHSKQDFAEVLRDYDVAFDTAFDTEERLLGALKIGAGAAYVSVVTPKLVLIDQLGLEAGQAAGEALFEQRIAEQMALGRTYAWSFMQPNGEAMREAGRLFEAGKMRSVIDRVYPLEELASAHEHSESGRVSGKIVVDIGGTG